MQPKGPDSFARVAVLWRQRWVFSGYMGGSQVLGQAGRLAMEVLIWGESYMCCPNSCYGVSGTAWILSDGVTRLKSGQNALYNPITLWSQTSK